MQSECIGVADIANTIVSFLFIAGKGQFYGVNDNDLDVKSLEFINWVRLVGPYSAKDANTKVFDARFRDKVFSEHFMENKEYINECIATTNLYYFGEVMKLSPPEGDAFCLLMNDILYSRFWNHKRDSGSSGYFEYLIDWVEHIDFDINH